MAFDVDASQREAGHVDMPDLRDKDMGGQAVEQPPEVKEEGPEVGWVAGVPAILLMLAPLLII